MIYYYYAIIISFFFNFDYSLRRFFHERWRLCTLNLFMNNNIIA